MSRELYLKPSTCGMTIKKGTSKEEMKERTRQAVKDGASCGTQFIRAQTGCTNPNLTGIKAALEVRDELKDNITIQVAKRYVLLQ